MRVTAVNLLPELGVVVTRFHDVTDLRLAWEQAVAVATDELTGLASRAAVRAEIERRLTAGDRTVAVLFCDLDGFKAVNDRQGHLAGDELLARVGRRLRDAVRPDGGLIGRWGGDEFVAVLDVAGRDEALAVGTRLRASASIGRDAGGPVGASVGVALGGLGDEVDDLLARADAAMYGVKRAGGGVAAG
jgi:diguanylate cyclase (GGDEF)-like protein